MVTTQNTGKALQPDSLSTAIARFQERTTNVHNETAPLFHLEHFTVHDLRRSFARQATETHISDPQLVEMMLAHAPPKLMATYNRAKRWIP